MREEFEELVGRFPPEVARIARRARELVRGLVPDGVESCEGGDHGLGTTAGYGSGPRDLAGRRQRAAGPAARGGAAGPARPAGGHREGSPVGAVDGLDQLDRPQLIELLRAQAGA